MSGLMIRLIQNSLIVSVMFLLIQLLRPTMKKVRHSMFKWIWIICALFLLNPFEFHIPDITKEIQIKSEIAAPVLNDYQESEVIYFSQSELNSKPVNVQNSAFDQVSILDMVSYVWAITALVLFCFQMFTYLWFQRLLKMTSIMIHDSKRVSLIESDLVDSPLLTGLFHPVIAVPSSVLDHPHLDVMIHHELTHYQHHDLWIKLLMLITRCVHWFNPVIYLMEKQCANDLELVCDETVLKDAGENERQIYAQTLLDMAYKNRFSKAAFTTQFSTHDFKKRISGLFDTSRTSSGKVFCVLCLCGFIIFSLLVSIKMISTEKAVTIYLASEPDQKFAKIYDPQMVSVLYMMEDYSYTDKTDVDPQYIALINDQKYMIDVNDNSITVTKDGLSAYVVNTDHVSMYHKILKGPDSTLDSDVQTDINTKPVPTIEPILDEHTMFEQKGYLNVLNEVALFSESNASLSQYMVTLNSSNTSIKYTYYDLLMEFYYTDTLYYQINGKDRSSDVVIALTQKEGFDSYVDGRVTTSDGTVYLIGFDYDTLTVVDGEEGSPTFGKPMKFAKELNDQLVDLYKKCWNQSVLQYQILRAWHLEFNEVQNGLTKWDEIDSAYQLEIDKSQCLKLNSINETHSVDFRTQAAYLTEQFLIRNQYNLEFDGFSSSDINDNYIMWDMYYVTEYKDNPNHPYASLVQYDVDGAYVYMYDDIKEYAYQLFGLQWEVVESTEGINSKEDHYVTGWDFGWGFREVKAYDISELSVTREGNQIFVHYDLYYYKYNDEGTLIEKDIQRHGISEFYVITENNQSFLRHYKTTIEKQEG